MNIFTDERNHSVKDFSNLNFFWSNSLLSVKFVIIIIHVLIKTSRCPQYLKAYCMLWWWCYCACLRNLNISVQYLHFNSRGSIAVVTVSQFFMGWQYVFRLLYCEHFELLYNTPISEFPTNLLKGRFYGPNLWIMNFWMIFKLIVKCETNRVRSCIKRKVSQNSCNEITQHIWGRRGTCWTEVSVQTSGLTLAL